MKDSKISLLLFTTGSTEGREISELVQSITWKGRKGSAARSITVKLIDDDGYKHERSKLDIEKGQQCVFCYDGEELFRGLIMSQTQSHMKQLRFTAYDNGIYLANNKDTFTYTNKTATDVFKDVCNRFGLPMEDIASCTYKIPELTESKKTAWDTICDALSLDFDNTGVRHYVSSDKGKISLRTRKENVIQWVIETGQNITSYTYTKSIENIKTRIKMLSDEGKVLAEAKNTDLEKKIGTFQDIDRPEETLNSAQITALAKSVLETESQPERSLEIEALGIPEVISGVGVFIIIPHLGLNRTFYVDADTHTFEDCKHTMSLTLNYASDAGTGKSKTGEAQTQKSSYGFKRNLSYGCSGTDVTEMQKLLIAAGYPMNPYGADGLFGPVTLAAVKDFQKAKGLSVDGIAGKNTITALGGSWQG